jgi:hypothetical protein
MPRIAACVATLLALACLATPSPTFAFNFILVGSGTDQHLNWYWEIGYPVSSCQSNPTPCGNISAVNGMFSNTANGQSFFAPGSSQSTTQGGVLSWVGEDSLKVTANASVRARVQEAGIFPQEGFAESWTAINVQDFPLIFLMQAEASDPPTTNLKIVPQLNGLFTHNTGPGCTSYVYLQMIQAVSVNGVRVTVDTLFTEWNYDDGADGQKAVQFPKGALNTVMVPDVPANSFIEVRLWSYTRARVTTPSVVFLVSDVIGGNPGSVGASMTVLAQPMGVVGVGASESPSSVLSLSASPNPTTGESRISYALPRAAPVRISIYDIAGHRVATLVDGFQEAGRQEVAWTGRTSGGQALSAGVYLIELVAGGERRMGKLAVAR